MTTHNRHMAAIATLSLVVALLSLHCSDETYQGSELDEPDASADTAATDDADPAHQDADTEDAATPDVATPDVATGPDASVDPSQRGVVTFVVENVGDEPAFIAAAVPYVTRAAGRPRAIPIEGMASSPHIELAPGHTHTESWDGHLLDDSPARIEDYVVEVPFSHDVLPAGDDPVTTEGDEILNATLAWPVQEASARFALSHEPVEVRIEVRAAAPVPERPFGSCGQAWTYRPDVQPEIAEQPADVRANSLALVRLRSVHDGPSCVRSGAVDIAVDADNHTVAIESGSYVGTAECDEASGEDYVAKIFDLTAGSWSVGLSGPDGSLVGAELLEVLACSGCMCEPTSETHIGESCQDDCDCGGMFRGGGSIQEVCVASACAQTCLWSADCPEGFRCDAGVDADGIASAGWCTAAPDESCATNSDCERGVCRDGQCAPMLDFTGLDSDGMGALCACDSECPGEQQCIRGPAEADVPRCALRCRDYRDCMITPTEGEPAYECDNQFGDCGTPLTTSAWHCSGHSPSGAPPVCVPN